eukprot:m.141749 g.141749  ORF g.141749 m.141749 type:complete len:77 (-) comp16136_c0_seq1:58-288(-)
MHTTSTDACSTAAAMLSKMLSQLDIWSTSIHTLKPCASSMSRTRNITAWCVQGYLTSRVIGSEVREGGVTAYESMT